MNLLVTILLAVYNGEKYLARQLDSVLGGGFKNFNILIRDDGSTDNSLKIAEEYADRYSQITVLQGEPTGSACRNFFELIKAADDDYVMFCDQDDYWLPDKIQKTFEKMLKTENGDKQTPVLIHTDLSVADAELNIIAPSFFKFQAISPERSALNNLLVQNNVTGCTVMINRGLLNLAKNVPDSCAMHDWWLALLAAAFGKTDYLDEPTMLYCQHGDNQVGAKKATGTEFIVRKIKTRKQTAANYRAAFAQANELLRLYGDKLTPKQRETVAAYAALAHGSKLKKIKTIRKYDFRKNTLTRTVGQYFSI